MANETTSQSPASGRRYAIIVRLSLVYLALTAINLLFFWVATGSRQMRLISEKSLSQSSIYAWELSSQLRPLLQNRVFATVANNPERDVDVSKKPIPEIVDIINKSILLKNAVSAAIVVDDGRVILDLLGQEKKAPGKAVADQASAENIQLLYKAQQQKEQKSVDFLAEPVAASHRLNIAMPFYSSADVVMGLVLKTGLPGIEKELNALYSFAIWMVVILLFIQSIFGYYLYRTLLKPLRRLTGAATEVEAGNLQVQVQPPRYHDELRSLVLIFNDMTLSLKEKTERLEQIIVELKNKDSIMQMELDMAQGIQKGIVPADGLVNHKSLAASIYYSPLHTVSGDYYDFFEMPSGATGLLMADASGHGVPAALITVMAKIYFQNAVARLSDPSEILAEVNRNLTRTVVTTDYITAFFIIIEPDGNFVYCNANHKPAYLIHHKTGSVEKLDGMGFMVGAMDPLPFDFEAQKGKLHIKDRLVLYTDGLIEAENSANEPFGEERFLKLIDENKNKDLNGLNDLIVKQVLEFSKDRDRFDDYTLLIAEFNPVSKTRTGSTETSKGKTDG